MERFERRIRQLRSLCNSRLVFSYLMNWRTRLSTLFKSKPSLPVVDLVSEGIRLIEEKDFERAMGGSLEIVQIVEISVLRAAERIHYLWQPEQDQQNRSVYHYTLEPLPDLYSG